MSRKRKVGRPTDPIEIAQPARGRAGAGSRSGLLGPGW